MKVYLSIDVFRIFYDKFGQELNYVSTTTFLLKISVNIVEISITVFHRIFFT